MTQEADDIQIKDSGFIEGKSSSPLRSFYVNGSNNCVTFMINFTINKVYQLWEEVIKELSIFFNVGISNCCKQTSVYLFFILLLLLHSGGGCNFHSTI